MMNKLSKILMVLLALALAVSVLAFSAFATEPQTNEISASIYSDPEAANLVASYETVDAALLAAEAGQYVIIEKTTENFIPTDIVAEGIFVKAKDGVSFTTSNDTALTLTEADENTGYSTTWNAEYTITVGDVTTKYELYDESGISTLPYNVSAAVKGATTYVKLLSDIADNTAASFTYGTSSSSGDDKTKFLLTGKTLYFDLNGCTLSILNAGTDTKIFNMYGNSSKVYLYSSIPGGAFRSEDARFMDYTSGSRKSCQLNMGEVTVNGTTYDGDNLTVYAKYICYYSAAKGSSGGTNYINIKGGTYYAYTQGFNGRGAINISIEDATMVTGVSGIMSFTSDKGVAYDSPAFALSAKNSTFISISDKGVLSYAFKAIPSGCSATFDDCKIVGTIQNSAENKGTITFKNGTLLATTTNLSESTVISTDDNILLEASGTKNLNVYLSANNPNTVLTPTPITISYTYAALSKDDIPKSLKTNVSTNNGFLINFYFAENSGMAILDGAEIGNQITVGGVIYNVYTTAAISPASVDERTVKYSFKLADKDISFITETSVSLLDYFKIAFDTAKTATDKSLIVNAVNYCNEVYEYATGAEYAEYTAIVEKAEEGMITTEFGNKISKTYGDYDRFILSAQLIVAEANVPMFAFGAVDPTANIFASYTDITGKKITVQCDTQTIANKTYYVVKEMKAYDMIATITLSLDEAGEGKLLEYNLASYVGSASGATTTVDDALASFAIAAYNYKTLK